MLRLTTFNYLVLFYVSCTVFNCMSNRLYYPQGRIHCVINNLVSTYLGNFQIAIKSTLAVPPTRTYSLKVKTIGRVRQKVISLTHDPQIS